MDAGLVLFTGNYQEVLYKNANKKKDRRYGKGVVTAATECLASALSAATAEEIPRGAIRAVQVPDDEDANAKRLGSVFEKDIVFIENSVRRRVDFEGVNLPEMPDTIFIDAATRHPALQVAAHELLHTIRRSDPKVYQSLRDAVFPYIKHIGQYQAEFADRNTELVNELLGDGHNYNRYLYEELVADFVGEHIADTKFWHDLNGRMPAGAFREFAYHVKSFFKDVMKKIGISKDKPSAKFFQDIPKVIEAVDKALEACAGQTVGVPGKAIGTKFGMALQEADMPSFMKDGQERDDSAKKSALEIAEDFFQAHCRAEYPEPGDTASILEGENGLPVLFIEKSEDGYLLGDCCTSIEIEEDEDLIGCVNATLKSWGDERRWGGHEPLRPLEDPIFDQEEDSGPRM